MLNGNVKVLRMVIRAGALWLMAMASCIAQADWLEPGTTIMVQGAPDAIHYSYSPEHVKYSWLVGVEAERTDRWLAGFSYFNNSFGQKCEYIYGGKSWPVESVSKNLYVKLTGGVILGYKDPYENKIPVNSNGVGLGVIPAIGYKYERFNVQMNILGSAGLMFTVGYDLYKK